MIIEISGEGGGGWVRCVKPPSLDKMKLSFSEMNSGSNFWSIFFPRYIHTQSFIQIEEKPKKEKEAGKLIVKFPKFYVETCASNSSNKTKFIC